MSRLPGRYKHGSGKTREEVARHATDRANLPAAVKQLSACMYLSCLCAQGLQTLGAEVPGVATLGPLLNIKCQFAQSGQRGAARGHCSCLMVITAPVSLFNVQ